MKLKDDPLGAPRNPLAIYLLILASVSGLSTMSGVTTARAVERHMPMEIVFLWGLILFVGATATLVGMFWQGDIRTGLVMKRSGMFSTGVAAIVYGCIVFSAVGVGATFAAGTIVGFGLACFAQFHQINKRIHKIIEATP